MKHFLILCLHLIAFVHLHAAEKPNILLIFADDIGYEALNCYGGQDFETPHLNRMAQQGMKFTRAYTSPVCTPSRVSMHTGLYTTRHGHYDVLPVHNGTLKKVDFQSMPTFAQQIRANGYLTSTTGKWQLATLQHHPQHIRDAGFDSWCVWQIFRDGEKTDRHWNPIINHDGKIRGDVADRFGPDVIADYVIAQMRAAKSANQPFLIVHNELLPHWPVVETPDDRKLKRTPSLKHFIHYMDQIVGKLLGEIESLGIRDNTYVIFMGDNGTWAEDFSNPRQGQAGELAHTRHTSAGPVNGGKAELSDAGCHVPFLVWGPSTIPAGKSCDELVDVVDVFPTFCELSHTTIPAKIRIDGRSIAPQIHGKPGVPRFWTHNALGKRHGGETLFDGKFRVFRNDDKIIDVRSFPLEKTPDAKDPDALAAKTTLKQVFEKLVKNGPRPPVSFAPQPAGQ